MLTAGTVHERFRALRLAPWTLAAVLAGIAAGASIPLVMGIVAALGRNIPSPDLATDYAKGVLWALLLGSSILLWPATSSERLALAGIWLVKCLVTLGFMLFYEWNYQLDAYVYFAGSQDPHVAVAGAVTGTGAIEALTWWHAHHLVDSYHAMKVSFAMVGLVAIYLIYRAACYALHERSRVSLLLGLACFPSILFWSSILGKDPLVLLGIALYVYGIVPWLRDGRVDRLLVAGFGVAVAAAIRIWLGPILALPALIAGLLRMRSATQRAVVLVVGTMVMAVAMIALRSYFAFGALSDAMEFVGKSSQAWAEGGSGQKIASDFSNPVTLLLFIPRGAFTALFRPLPGEVLNPFGLLSGLENAFLLFLLAQSVRRTRWRDFRDPVVLWAVLLLAIWASLYGPISYQNLGAAVRFRLQVLPVELLILLYLSRSRRPATAPLPS